MKITAAQYAKTLYESVKGKPQKEISEVVSNFVKLLIKKNQIKNGGKIIEKFSAIYNEENGIVEAEAATARKLEGSQVHKIESFLKKKYKAKKIILNNIIDEKIKGGIVIRVGDELMEASVVGYLADLKNNLEK